MPITAPMWPSAGHHPGQPIGALAPTPVHLAPLARTQEPLHRLTNNLNPHPRTLPPNDVPCPSCTHTPSPPHTAAIPRHPPLPHDLDDDPYTPGQSPDLFRHTPVPPSRPTATRRTPSNAPHASPTWPTPPSTFPARSTHPNPVPLAPCPVDAPRPGSTTLAHMHPSPVRAPQPVQCATADADVPPAHPSRAAAIPSTAHPDHGLPGLHWTRPAPLHAPRPQRTFQPHGHAVQHTAPPGLPPGLTRLTIHCTMMTTVDHPSSDVPQHPRTRPAPSTCISRAQAPLMHFHTPRPSSACSHYPRRSPHIPPHALTPARHAPSPVDAFRCVPTCMTTR